MHPQYLVCCLKLINFNFYECFIFRYERVHANIKSGMGPIQALKEAADSVAKMDKKDRQ